MQRYTQATMRSKF